MSPQREIYRGPILGRQRQALLAALKAYIQQGRGSNVIYLAASRPLLDAVSRYLLDGQDCLGSFDGLPVYLFNGFIRRLLGTALVAKDGTWVPAPRRRDISGEDYPLRRPLIAQIMRQLMQQERLPAFGRLATSGGCVASVIKLIGEITRAGKTADEFEQIVQHRLARHRESLPAPDPTGERAPHPAEQVYGYEQDLALIARCYSAALKAGGFTESDYDYLRAIAALDGQLDGRPCRTPFLESVAWVIVDGFFDLTPVQGEILRRLVARVPRLTFHVEDDVNNPQVFAPVRETVAKICAMGEGFTEVTFYDQAAQEPDDPGQEAFACHTIAAGLEVLRQGLFNPSYTPPQAAGVPPPPVFVAVAPDIERELRNLAKTIKRYVVFDRLPPSDIAIVIRDKESYGPHLRRILTDEGIAYTLDERLPVTDIPAVRAWFKVLAAAIERPDTDRHPPPAARPPAIPVGHLVAVLKSDYFAVPGSDISADDVENVVTFVGDKLHLDAWLTRAERLAAYLRGSEATVGDSTGIHETVTDERLAGAVPADESPEMASTPTVRPDAVTAADLEAVGGLLKQLGCLLATIPVVGPPQTLIAAIEQVVLRLGFETRLETNIRAAVGRPRDLLQATLDLRGLQAIRRALAAAQHAHQWAAHAVTDILGENANAQPAPTTLAVLQADLLRALDGLTLRVEPETFGAVRILEATEVRGLHFPVIFVPGLVEGGFPCRLPGDWIYPAAERERLKNDGLTLEDISPATLAKEEHYFYQVVCRATRAVHLSYPNTGAEEEELLPSSFLAEIQRLIAETRPGGRQYTTVPKGYDGATLLQASTRHELLRQTAAVVSRQQRGVPIETLLLPPDDDLAPTLLPSEQVAEIQTYIDQNGWHSKLLVQRLDAEQKRYGDGWSPFDGCIASTNLQDVLAEYFGPTYVFSATALNEYAACPFRFFSNRVLRLRPRVVAALDLPVVERGRLMHDILRDFYREIPSETESKQNRLGRLQDVANRVFTTYEQRLPPLNEQLWNIEKRILLRHLERLIAEEMQPGNVIFTELAFGMSTANADGRSNRQPLKLSNELGEIIQLCGQIDRVDCLKNSKQEMGAFVVYDYKLSTAPSVRDMLEGRDVQIAIYLKAIENCFPDLRPLVGGGYFTITKEPRCQQGLYRLDYANLLNQYYGYTFLNKEEFESKLKIILNYVWTYHSRIKQGQFKVLPARGYRECNFCDFSAVCRYETYRIRRKIRSICSPQ